MPLVYRFVSKPEPTTTEKLYGWIDFTWTVTKVIDRRHSGGAVSTADEMCIVCGEPTELTGFSKKKKEDDASEPV